MAESKRMGNGTFAHAGRSWVHVMCAVGAAFALKLFVFSQLRGHPLLQPDAGLDTTAYVELARRVLAGDIGLGPGLYYVSPLYIYFLALAHRVTGSFAAVQMVQLALGALTVGCVFMMAREWAGTRAAWIAAALAIGCGVLTFHELVLMQSALDPLLTACALTLLTMAFRAGAGKPRAWLLRFGGFFGFGWCLGLQALNRPQILLPAVGLVFLLLLSRRVKPAAIAAAGLAIALAPVGVRNVIVADQWSLVSSHGGLNFYIGNHGAATGLYQLVPGIRPGIEGQREDTRRVAEAALNRPLTDAEVSGYYSGLAWRWIAQNPGGALRLFGKKLMLSIHADHSALPHSFEFFAQDVGSGLRWLVLNPGLIMPLGLAGLWFARPRGSREETVNFGVWAMFVPLYAVALAVFFLAERYRLPLLVPGCVGAGMCIDWMLRGLTRSANRSVRPQVARSVGVTVLLAVVVNWPFNLADGREGDRLRMVQYAASRQDLAEADRWATLVVSASTVRAGVNARLGPIYLNAGRRASANGDLALAAEWFKRGTDAEPARAEAWAQFGLALLFSNRLGEATPALQESVRLNPEDAAAIGGLAVCVARQGKSDEALRLANAALALDPHEPLATQVRVALQRH